MRRKVPGKPLLIVTAAAAVSAIAGCSSSHTEIDASMVSGNLSVSLDAGVDSGPPDAGEPDASVVSGNLSVNPPDAGTDGS